MTAAITALDLHVLGIFIVLVVSLAGCVVCVLRMRPVPDEVRSVDEWQGAHDLFDEVVYRRHER